MSLPLHNMFLASSSAGRVLCVQEKSPTVVPVVGWSVEPGKLDMGCSAAQSVTSWWAGQPLQPTQLHLEKGYYLQLLWEPSSDRENFTFAVQPFSPAKQNQAGITWVFHHISQHIPSHHDKGLGCVCGLILHSYGEFCVCKYTSIIFNVNFTVQALKCEVCIYTVSHSQQTACVLTPLSCAVARNPR